ncbi:ornithine carbamoyltransferase [Candidatus Peregrinibacteria bacterium]|nr:ornithine carbamoyltransferase [Candidatus Peregrinibacteria bacterium]
MKKDLTKITDLEKHEIQKIIQKAFEFKQKSDLHIPLDPVLKGKVVAMIFEKPSLRTKVAFEVATAALGGISSFLSSSQILQSGNNEKGRESLSDIAKNLERFADLILARVYSHQTIITIADSTQKPVINALCDEHHPTQALADLMAIMWHKKNYQECKVVFIGDGNNVATSLMEICAIMGINFAIASPKGYEIPSKYFIGAKKYASENDSSLEQLEDPYEAVVNADVVYTDTFISMGQEDEKEKRFKAFSKYQVDMKLLKSAKTDAIFMHNLPAHRGEEVTDEVIDSPQSIVFDEAECRLHIAKSLLTFYI